MTTYAVLPKAIGVTSIRDKCNHCGKWTIFEMFLSSAGFHTKCSCCRDATPFARNVAEARFKARSVDNQVALLALEYPQLSTLTREGQGVELPSFVRREDRTYSVEISSSMHGTFFDA